MKSATMAGFQDTALKTLPAKGFHEMYNNYEFA